MEIVKSAARRLFNVFGLDTHEVNKHLSKWSIVRAVRQQGLTDMVARLRIIVPDISCQEESEKIVFNDYWELKRRALQAFQCNLMLKAINKFSKDNLTVVDIGDSAGTHMFYLKELSKDRFKINTISVNLDERAIRKIEARGQKAVLCRAEELDMHGVKVDLFTSFEMVEHLHDPAIFFYRLATRNSCNSIVMTVPYVKRSRVGLHHIRNKIVGKQHAEDVHVFELSPEDWSILLRHSGWKVVDSFVYRQYPSRWPIISYLLARYWRMMDYEGFWGAVLEKDTAISDQYRDWK